MRGNVYVGKLVRIERSARLSTEDKSIIVIEDGVYIGSNCRILALKGSKVILRRNTTLHSGVEIITKESKNGKGGCLEIGERAVIHRNNRIDISGDVYVGEETKTGDECFIHTHDHLYDKPGSIWKQGVRIGDVRIGKGCWIGTSVQIMPGVTIGDGAVVAAGSIVTKAIKSNMVAGGIPAKEIKKRFDSTQYTN